MYNFDTRRNHELRRRNHEDATATAPRRPSATTAAKTLGVARRVVDESSNGWPSSGSMSVAGFMLFKAVRCESLRFLDDYAALGERGNSLWATRVRCVNEKGRRCSLLVFSANSLSSALFSPLNRKYPLNAVDATSLYSLSTRDSNS